MTRLHVVGAGLAGLAAALRLSRETAEVVLYEAAGHAGGRCRSFHEAALDREIDNGNHLLLSGNGSARAYLQESGADRTFAADVPAAFPFVDLETGDRWTVRPNAGPVPWWILVENRRVAGTGPAGYLSALRLRRAGPDDTVAALLSDTGTLYRRFWEPLAVAVLNTPPEEAYARLLWPVLMETFALGAQACRPMFARNGLSHSLVDPALKTLTDRGVSIRFGQRLRAIETGPAGVTALEFAQETVSLGPEDAVVLAVPATAAAGLLPGLPAPSRFCAIVNVHFRVDGAGASLAPRRFLGVIGGVAEWIFIRDDIVSVTVSAADSVAEAPAEDIARQTWADVTRALDLENTPLPRYKVVKEKRATFAQTPESERLRPPARFDYPNLLLAGDWTNTRLPATIEGSIRSGFHAAELLLAEIRQ